MSEKELLLYILDWLKLHHGDVLRSEEPRLNSSHT